MLTANLMTAKPISVEYLELQFNRSRKTNVWVLFSGEGFTPWVGIFGDARSSLFSGIARFYGTGTFLIIAGGQGYVVDAVEKRLIRQTRWSYSYSCCAVPERSCILVADTQEVWVCSIDNDILARARVKETWFMGYNNDGKRIPPSPEEYFKIALDGIILECVTEISASGKAWWGLDWHSFKIDLRDMSAHIEDKIIYSQPYAFTALPNVGGYPLSPDYITKMASYHIE